MLHTIENEFLKVTVSEQGAELQSILASDGTEFLWQGDPTFWRSRATNLFPAVGRLKDGVYYMDGRAYELGIHGFARHNRFSVAWKKADSIALELRDNESIYAQYPRHHIFRLVYTLQGNTLHISYQVDNLDEKPLHFGIGGHPGFRVPMVEGLDFSDYRLRFAEQCHPKVLPMTLTGFPSGQELPYALVEDCMIPLDHGLFTVDAIVLKDMCPTVSIEAPGSHHKVTVSCPDFPYMGFWHKPNSQAPFVCVEPWATMPPVEGEARVYDECDGLIHLAPGGHYENSWTVCCEF